MVQDWLSASCVSVDQLGVWEVNGEELFDEQCGVVSSGLAQGR